jgi:alpha-tubulin suppressor-like RCC1 family protein
MRQNKFKIMVGCWLLLYSQASGRAAAPTVIGIASGFTHNLILKSDGSLWAVGGNGLGELGTGTSNDSPFAIEIESSNVTAVAAGEFHSLFLKSDTSLWAMGWNGEGQLADGTNLDQHVPQEIYPAGVFGIAAGGYCSLFTRSHSPVSPANLWASGRNAFGEIGAGSVARTFTPIEIVPATLTVGASALSAGDSHSLFLKSDGSLWGMGLNLDGELGDPGLTNHTVPTEIVSNSVIAVTAGGFHTLFIKSDGSLWGTGQNLFGQLGTGATTNQPSPVMIVSNNVTAVAGGLYHTLFVKTDGSLWGMGYNADGELGDGTTNNSVVPELIVSNGVTGVSAGGLHGLFIKSDGSLWGMGDNGSGNLGFGDPNVPAIPLPAQIMPLAALNGDFEFGSFLGWNPDVNFSPVENHVTNKPDYVHPGTFGAQLGQFGTMGFISQTRPTIPGATYFLSFWLNNPGGQVPNEFRAVWDGAAVVDVTNLPSVGWTNLQFVVKASQASTVIQFGILDQAGFLGLDDIRFGLLPSPKIKGAALAGSNLVLRGENGAAGEFYCTLTSTNAALPLAQWTSVATNMVATDGTFTITATNAVTPGATKQFFCLQFRK